MQVDTIRMTGKPVNISDRDEYAKEWMRLYDKAELACKVRDPITRAKSSIVDNLRLQKKLAKLENALAKRYKTVIKTELPVTTEGWSDLMSQYGGLPILVTQSLEDNRIILVIQDVEFQAYNVAGG